MRTLKSLLVISVAALSLASCDVKDPIYNTDHPDHGTITLTTDWSAGGTGIDIPATYRVRMGDFNETFTQPVNSPEDWFEPGDYNLLVYNEPGNPTVNGTTATANYSAGALGWLFTSAQSVAIEADNHHNITAVMRQQVRELTLVIEPTGGSSGRIENITASLSGAAGTFDFESGTHAAPSNVPLTFTQITDGADAGKWSATVRLLGVTGTQRLTGTITFAGGSPGNMPLDSDLTSGLSTFNDNKTQPLQLGGTIIETPTGAGFTATINDWEKKTGTGVAN